MPSPGVADVGAFLALISPNVPSLSYRRAHWHTLVARHPTSRATAVGDSPANARRAALTLHSSVYERLPARS